MTYPVNRMRCRGKKIKGSGYTKPLIFDNSLSPDMQALLVARKAQDIRYFPSGFQTTVVPSATAYATVVPSTVVLSTVVPSATAYATVVSPVEPNPPAPRSVSGPGSASTTTTSSQGLKSPAASCTSRSCVLIE